MAAIHDGNRHCSVHINMKVIRYDLGLPVGLHDVTLINLNIKTLQHLVDCFSPRGDSLLCFVVIDNNDVCIGRLQRGAAAIKYNKTNNGQQHEHQPGYEGNRKGGMATHALQSHGMPAIGSFKPTKSVLHTKKYYTSPERMPLL